VVESAEGVGVLLACFDGVAKASKIRKGLGGQIQGSGATILDEVVLRVDAKGKALVYDPRRTVAGALTPALTWGVFGALTGGGLSGLVIWAIIGGVLGGLAGYYLEHTLTNDQLTRIGQHIPADSSAFAAFVRTADAPATLKSTATYEPTTASIAMIDEHLAARVWSGSANPTELAPASAEAPATDATTLVSMLIVRYEGQHTVNDVAAQVAKGTTIQPDLLFEVDPNGKKHVSSPTTGVAFTRNSSAPWWAAFGLVFGVVAGWTGSGGILGALQDGLVTAIAWGLFGVVAGSLYGLWAGRAISAGRLKRVSALLPPDSSAMIAWADGAVTTATLSELSRPAAEGVVLGFRRTGRGVVLEARNEAMPAPSGP